MQHLDPARIGLFAVIFGITCVPGAWGQLDSLDPSEDGWDSEAFGIEVDVVLKKVQSFLTGEQSLGDLAVPGFVSTPLVPGQTSMVKRTPFSIRRMQRGKDSSKAEKTTLARALAPLTRSFESGKASRTYVKTIETSLNDETAQSRHLVLIAGEGGDRKTEQNAEWLVRWALPGEGAPRLAGIELLNWEETAAPKHATFTEITSSVIADPVLRTQLGPGTDAWRSRIENYMHIHLFGQRGVAVGDVNGDLLDDVYLCQPGGLPNRLLLHQIDGTARDGSAAFGLDFLDNTRAALFVDLDNDGDSDLAMTTHNGLLLLENQDQRKFVPKVSVPHFADGQAIVAADHDHNGFVDLYVCSYFRNNKDAGELALPVPYFDARNGGPNLFLTNSGDWRFANRTAEVGLDTNNDRWSWAAIWFDANADGFSDLYVANDFGKDCLYLNVPGENGRRFREVTETAGLATGAFGMSVSVADYDGDQHPDLYVGNMFSSAGSRITRQPGFQKDATASERAAYRRLAAGNTLFRHDGSSPPSFSEQSASGASVGRWSWSSLFADINNDSWPDLLVANGYVTGTREAVDL